MSKPKVLVADDDEDIRDAIVFILQRGGYQVVEAVDGREALDYVLASGLPHLILLDMNMPVMSGRELMSELRARGLTGAPIVVITAAYDAQRTAEEIGAAGFIGKPFDLEVLLETVGRHIGSGLIGPIPRREPSP
ncbi:MAG: cheY [Myxococcales bacterium]|nr:cheY [Myxococcales bacterium]